MIPNINKHNNNDTYDRIIVDTYKTHVPDTYIYALYTCFLYIRSG